MRDVYWDVYIQLKTQQYKMEQHQLEEEEEGGGGSGMVGYAFRLIK